ncbi:MAG TPA: hypothetical protein VNX28_02785 [Gemmataceae bacterium]|nr:hypothetical protein [Gemmataceae bacterium]
MPLPHTHLLKKPLVVGAPRSGFSLLISVIHNLMNRSGVKPARSYRQTVINRVVDVAGYYTTNKYRATCARLGITRDLVFSGEFHLLVGGPKWLDPANPQRASIRKYIGIRGMGDILLVTSHPRAVLDYDDVLHSHTAPGMWEQQDAYDSYVKFTSVRNPVGIINSAAFSLNAMASEYIQKFLPEESEDHIRLRHGLYKLTDLEFFSGLVRFLKNYLDDYLPWRDRYLTMKWEDLITRPAQVICWVAKSLGLECSEKEALALWAPMDHVNLLRYHKHNYRRGRGIVGDWKNSLVGEHVDIFRAHGFDKYLDLLGYPPLPALNPRQYTPYQKLVARYLQRGEVYRDTGDPDLFGFAFNKTNIDASRFAFKSFPARTWTRVERSTLTRDDVVLALSDTAEECSTKINHLLLEVLEAGIETRNDALDCLRYLEREWIDLMSEVPDGRGVALLSRFQEGLHYESV